MASGVRSDGKDSNMGRWEVGRVVDGIGGVGVCGSRHDSRMVIRGGGSGSGSVSGSGSGGG